MEQYKLIKKYPSLPEDWKEGMIVVKENKNSHFLPLDRKYTKLFIFHPEVTNSPEYWEKVVEKDYEILTLKAKSSGSVCLVKELYDISSGIYQNFDHFVKSFTHSVWDIHSVKRLSDDEIFTVGDDVSYHKTKTKIEKIYFNEHNQLSFKVIGTKAPLTGVFSSNMIHLKKLTKPLFKTKDGVDIFEGDEFYRVWKINNTLKTDNYRLFASKNYAFNTVSKNTPHFSTKEKAEEYIFRHAPSLSLNDVNNTLDVVEGRFFGDRTELLEKLTELIKSRK